MKILDLEQQESHLCPNCESEFTVNLISDEIDEPISFCPYCGSELDFDQQDDDIDEEFPEDTSWD